MSQLVRVIYELKVDTLKRIFDLKVDTLKMPYLKETGEIEYGRPNPHQIYN